MDAEDHNIGRLVAGRYRLDALLGRGGFGSVYRGWDTQIGRDIAVKLLDVANHARSAEQNAELRERFRREAMAAGRINHPSVVTIYDFGIPDDGTEAFIVMELLDGRDLADQLDQRGPLEPDRALRLFLPMLEALGRGHELGIVHKDIKPQNIFLRNPGTPKESMCLVDFGVARVVHEDKLTMTGLIVGTPQYMAPEYITETMVTPALDVYQCALILVEIITGVPAVPLGEAFVKSCNRHFLGDLDVPEELFDGPFGAVLKQAIEPNPARRFQDGNAFAQALRDVDPSTIALDFQSTMVFNRAPAVDTLTEPPLFPPMNPEQASAELERAERDPSMAMAKVNTPVSTQRPSSDAMKKPEIDPFGPTALSDQFDGVAAESRQPIGDAVAHSPKSNPAIQVPDSPPGTRLPPQVAQVNDGATEELSREENWEWGQSRDQTHEAPGPPPAAPSSGVGVGLAALALAFLFAVVVAGAVLFMMMQEAAEPVPELPPRVAIIDMGQPSPDPALDLPTKEVAAESETIVEPIDAVLLSSEPIGAKIVVEGVVIGQTPRNLESSELAGKSVVLRLRGYEDAQVDLSAGSQTLELQEEKPEPQKSSKQRRAKKWDRKPSTDTARLNNIIDQSDLAKGRQFDPEEPEEVAAPVDPQPDGHEQKKQQEKQETERSPERWDSKKKPSNPIPLFED